MLVDGELTHAWYKADAPTSIADLQEFYRGERYGPTASGSSVA